MSSARRFSSISSMNSTFPRHIALSERMFVSEAERDTHVVIMLQHFYFSPFGTGMEVKSIVFITEVHRNYIWIAFQVRYAYKAGIGLKNNGFDSLLVFDNDCFHSNVSFYRFVPNLWHSCAIALALLCPAFGTSVPIGWHRRVYY